MDKVINEFIKQMNPVEEAGLFESVTFVTAECNNPSEADQEPTDIEVSNEQNDDYQSYHQVMGETYITYPQHLYPCDI